MKIGRTGPPLEPRRRPQVGKYGDPRSQNTDKTKLVDFVPGDSSKQFSISVNLDPK